MAQDEACDMVVQSARVSVASISTSMKDAGVSLWNSPAPTMTMSLGGPNRERQEWVDCVQSRKSIFLQRRQFPGQAKSPKNAKGPKNSKGGSSPAKSEAKQPIGGQLWGLGFAPIVQIIPGPPSFDQNECSINSESLLNKIREWVAGISASRSGVHKASPFKSFDIHRPTAAFQGGPCAKSFSGQVVSLPGMKHSQETGAVPPGVGIPQIISMTTSRSPAVITVTAPSSPTFWNTPSQSSSIIYPWMIPPTYTPNTWGSTTIYQTNIVPWNDPARTSQSSAPPSPPSRSYQTIVLTSFTTITLRAPPPRPTPEGGPGYDNFPDKSNPYSAFPITR